MSSKGDALEILTSIPGFRLSGAISNIASNLFGGKKRKRDSGAISDEVRQYAILADAAYKTMQKSKLKEMDKIFEDHPYEYLADSSTSKISVFRNKLDNSIITSFRGTKVSDFDDLLTDVHVAVGNEKFSAHMKQAKRQMEKILKDFPDSKHVVVGHSLGGTVVRNMLENFADKIDEGHAFNPGSCILCVKEGLRSKKRRKTEDSEDDNNFHPNFHSHIIAGDPISEVGRYDDPNVTIYNQLEKSNNAHSIHQFFY